MVAGAVDFVGTLTSRLMVELLVDVVRWLAAAAETVTVVVELAVSVSVAVAVTVVVDVAVVVLATVLVTVTVEVWVEGTASAACCVPLAPAPIPAPRINPISSPPKAAPRPKITLVVLRRSGLFGGVMKGPPG